MDLSQQKQIHGYVSLPKCNLLLPAIESLHVEHVVQSLWTLAASNPGPGDLKHMNQAMCGESQRQPHNYLEMNSHKQLYIYIYLLYIYVYLHHLKQTRRQNSAQYDTITMWLGSS